MNSSASGSTEAARAARAEQAWSLVADRGVRLVVVALLLASLPLLLPFVSAEFRAFYGQRIADLPFLLLAAWACWKRLQTTAIANERWFWQSLLIALGLWGLALVADPLADAWLADSPALHDITTNAPYLLFYAGLAAAVEIRPHTRRDPITYGLRVLDWIASGVLLLSLLVYFLVLPGVALGGAKLVWISSLALFVSLDVYIMMRLWDLRDRATNSTWRAIYSWLLVAAVLWTAGDLTYLMMSQGLVADPGWGTPLDLIWSAALAAVFVATRPTPSDSEREQRPIIPYHPLGVGPMVVYAVAPLLFHVLLYRFGLPDARFQEPREALVLLTTAMLAALTMVYHRQLREENRRLAERQVAAREQLSHLAFHDELTGLPNRNLFQDRLDMALAEAQRRERKCAVLFCDLDNFKVINDSLGHETGDLVISAAASRLRESVRNQDTVARIGGDEFAVIIQDMEHGMDAVAITEKLMAALAQPISLGDKSHVITASIGISVFPDDGKDRETLLKHADVAMYQSKLHGRNTFRLFTQAMNDAADERMAIEQGLRIGLEEDRFAVFYQPVYDLRSRKVVSHEALLRWNHPERGWISPVSFMDVAEQTGLIIPMGRWVLEHACAWAAAQGGNTSSLSVNMSVQQLRDPHLTEDIHRVLQQTGLPPERLKLEISESLALTNSYSADVLRELRSLGVQIALDDFGTGYAALGELRDLPLDILKIDRTLVTGIEANSVSEAIVRAIIKMADALDFYVVAEGVETEQEYEVIRQAGCDAVQGYYLCAPLPAEKIIDQPNQAPTRA